MLHLTLKNTWHGSLPGNGCGGFIATIRPPSPGSFFMGKTIEYKRGQKLGECIFLYRTGRKLYRSAYGRFKCRCGNEFEAIISSVKKRTTKTCGCLHHKGLMDRNTTHGLCKHPLYVKWCSMKNRCYDPQNDRYYVYGGRGIKVCDQWEDDFKAYFDYVMPLENAMKDGYSIDRIDNDGNYEPGNLRWATKHTQAANKGTYKNNILGYVGIRKIKNRYVAKIGLYGKNIYIKTCKSAKDAAIARDQYIIDNKLWEYPLQVLTKKLN